MVAEHLPPVFYCRLCEREQELVDGDPEVIGLGYCWYCGAAWDYER